MFLSTTATARFSSGNPNSCWTTTYWDTNGTEAISRKSPNKRSTNLYRTTISPLVSHILAYQIGRMHDAETPSYLLPGRLSMSPGRALQPMRRTNRYQYRFRVVVDAFFWYALLYLSINLQLTATTRSLDASSYPRTALHASLVGPHGGRIQVLPHNTRTTMATLS